MIVNKTLKIINKINNHGKLFVLGNDVITTNGKLATLKNSEKEDFIKLIKRNKNIEVFTSWIDYIRLISKINVDNLNRTHYYKYEDRGWELIERDDEYVVSIFLDNFDVEQFAYVTIPKNSISDKDLEFLKRTDGKIF